MTDKKYYKITNAEENHHGFQYQDGLNVLKEPFNENPKDHCCAGGLYFTDIKNIFEFLNYGIYVREVRLPIDHPKFKMIKDENKYRANMIILGKRYELFSVETGVSNMLSAYLKSPLSQVRNCIAISAWETFKMLIEKGADNNYALRLSAKNGHLEVVKYLIEKGANVHADDDCALRWSAFFGHLEVEKYLLEKIGVDIDFFKD